MLVSAVIQRVSAQVTTTDTVVVKATAILPNSSDVGEINIQIFDRTTEYLSPSMEAMVPDITLVSMINPQNASYLLFHPEGELEITYWSEDFVQVQIEIADPYFEHSHLKSLAGLGLYNLDSEVNGFLAAIEMPGQRKQVSIDGILVQHRMRFLLSVPNHMKVIPSSTWAIEKGSHQ